MTEIFYPTTKRHKEWGGPKRYFRLVLHDSTPELRIAANRYSLGNNFSQAAGVFHPAPNREFYNKARDKWIDKTDKHYGGIIRLSREYFTYDTIVHECVHAGAAIYRMDVRTIVNLGNGCWEAEETFAYICSDIADSVCAKLDGRKK